MMNMKKYISLKLIGLALIMGFMASCDQSDQDVSPIGGTERYPLATFTNVNGTTSLTEGDTLFIKISLDKWIESNIVFNVNVEGVKEGDLLYPESVTLSGYSSEIILPVVAAFDNIPEETETATLSLSIDAVGLRYLIAPESQLPTYELTIANKNSADKLDIAFGWENAADDIDMYIFEETAGAWGNDGATGNNPEISTAIWPSDYDYYFATYGFYLEDYLVAIDPYYVSGPEINYSLAVGLPDQTNQYFTGTIVVADLQDSKYIYDSVSEMGGYVVLGIFQKLLDAENADDFTFTQVDPTVAK